MARLALAIFLLLGLATSAQAAGEKLAPKPEVGAILASFVPTDEATYYAIDVTEPPGAKPHAVSITWSLTPPPHNKTCKNFTSSGTHKIAVWNHGDGDGCSHVNFPRDGHPGIVSVVVRDAAYACTASYLGTDGGVGDNAVCITIQHADAARDLAPALAGGPLAARANALQKALADLSTLRIPAAATAASHLRQALAFATTSRPFKALAEARRAQALIDKLP